MACRATASTQRSSTSPAWWNWTFLITNLQLPQQSPPPCSTSTWRPIKYKVRCIHIKQTFKKCSHLSHCEWRGVTDFMSLKFPAACEHIHTFYSSYDSICELCDWLPGEVWHLNPAVREKKKCGKYDRNCKEMNTADPHHCIGKGIRRRHGKTRKAKRVEESKGEGSELWVVEWKESRLAKKRKDWYENICDGFRGKSARWARSTCCSPLHSLLFPLSAPVSHLSYLFLTNRTHIVMQRTWSQKPHTRFDNLLHHCKTHVTIMNIMWYYVCAPLAHRLWQSASAFLFFNLWCSRQQGCVPTRQTEGQTLQQ